MEYYTHPKKIKELYRLAYIVHDVLIRANITYFAESGTLLGALRHHGIINWDNDLDFSISHRDMEYVFKHLQSDFKRHGCHVRRQNNGWLQVGSFLPGENPEFKAFADLFPLELVKKKSIEKVVLKQHQVEAIEKMNKIEKETGKGMILSHALGLGKSLTVCSFLIKKRKTSKLLPDLIICPVAVVSHWQSEILRLDENMKIFIYHGPERKEKLEEVWKTLDFVIGTYHCFIKSELINRRFNYLVCDEAHVLRNGMESSHRKIPKKIQGAFEMKKVSKYRLCVTGTPFNNRVEDIHSLMAFIGYDYDDEFKVKTFVDKCVLQKSKDGIMEPYITHMVPIEMPLFTDSETGSKIIEPYMDAYSVYRRSMASLRNSNTIGSRENYIIAMNMLTKMKVFCDLFVVSVNYNEFNEFTEGKKSEDDDDDDEVDGEWIQHPFTSEQMIEMYDSSPKIHTVCDSIKEWIPKSPYGKILIFSSFTTVLKIIETIISSEIKCILYHGGMNRHQRDEAIKEFNTVLDTPMVFLATFGSANCGINLVPCSTVFIVDIPMNPFEVLQAVNRVHRLTQTNTVNVVKFYMKDLIEAKILKTHNRKIQESNNIGLVNDLLELDF